VAKALNLDVLFAHMNDPVSKAQGQPPRAARVVRESIVAHAIANVPALPRRTPEIDAA
jgi:hypothetical protein